MTWSPKWVQLEIAATKRGNEKKSPWEESDLEALRIVHNASIFALRQRQVTYSSSGGKRLPTRDGDNIHHNVMQNLGLGERGDQPKERDDQQLLQLLLRSKTMIQLWNEIALPSIVFLPPA
jgi:hypothetical protein